MTNHASGTFEVKLTPQPSEGPPIGRLTIDKQFHGDLEAASQGQMLSAMTDVEGSAGYVAIERVSGTLHGRDGSFILQHNGIMNRGEPQLNIMVVTNSGTGELIGLAGNMAIQIADGIHAYSLEYTLNPQP